MKRVLQIVAILGVLALAACGGQESPCTNPPSPVMQSIQPTSAPAHLALVTATLQGDSFMPTSVVYANDAIALETTCVSSSEVVAHIDVGLMHYPRTIKLNVFTPFATSCGPEARYACNPYTLTCGLTSNALLFTVTP